MLVTPQQRRVFVAERRITTVLRFDEDGRSEEPCKPFIRHRTFLVERAAWRWVVWGYVFAARFQKECHGRFYQNDHDCELCNDERIKPRVYALADRLMARAKRRSQNP